MSLMSFLLVATSVVCSPLLFAAETPVATQNSTTLIASDTSISATNLGGGLRGYIGSKIDPENSEPSFDLEPRAALVLPSKTTFTFLSTISRPLNQYENFQVPRFRLRTKQGFDLLSNVKTSIEFTANGLDIHRWAADGHMIRTSLALVIEKRVLDDQLLIYVKLLPFYQFNRYRQSTAGSTKPEYGFGEAIGIELKTGRTLISADVTIQQTHHSIWKNSYATSQEVAYYLTDAWSVGAGHSLLGSFIDESTGRSSGLKLFDNRQSQVQAFVGYEF